MRITLFDNHDSFTWNLAHDLERLGARVKVVREEGWSSSLWKDTDALVLSPGPGLPDEKATLMKVLTHAMEHRVPTLGVCLGMQALACQMGGRLVQLDEPLHGRVSRLLWSGDLAHVTPLGAHHVSEGLRNMEVGHYHSWVVDEANLPNALHVNARNDAGLVMAVSHKSLPVSGVQFHPESVLTPQGRILLKGWLQEAQRCLAISASKVSLNFS